MEGFEWVMELKDGMTAPAVNMRSALKAMESQMRATEAEIRSLQRTQRTYSDAGFKQGAAEIGKDLAQMRMGLSETRAQFKTLQSMNTGGKGLLASLSTATGIGLAYGVRALVNAEKEAIEGMAKLVEGGVALALEMSELREHSLRAFEGLSGSAAGGKEMYDSIQRLRKVLPESEKELGSWAAKLMGAGMVDPRSVNESIKAMASASALMGGGEQGAAAAEKVSNLIAKSLEGGKFKGMAKTLVGTGVSADDLAAQLGMSPAAFQAAFKKGTIEADKGIDALNDVLQRKGRGALEGTMGEVSVVALKAKEAWAHMFDGVDVTPLTEAFREMVGALDTAQPIGRAMKLTLTGAFTEIVKVAADATHAITLGLLYTELGVLKLMHVMAPAILQWRAWERNGTMLEAMKISLLGIAAVLGVVASLVVIAATPVYLLAKAFMFATEKVLELKAAITGVSDTTPSLTKIAPTNVSTFMGGAAPPVSPAHATGGRVGLPAPGEIFASVQPGETIVPRGGIEAMGSAASAAPAPSHTWHVDLGGIHIDGAGKSAPEIVSELESHLADLFDRMAIEAGGG